jgi:hypothetical protein
MPSNRQDRVDHWRALAAQAFDAAVQATDPRARFTLTSIAALYEDLAVTAELSDRWFTRSLDRAPSIASILNSTEPRMDRRSPKADTGTVGHTSTSRGSASCGEDMSGGAVNAGPRLMRYGP